MKTELLVHEPAPSLELGSSAYEAGVLTRLNYLGLKVP